MELRRYKDILAVKKAGTDSPALAFHARNLEVAALSEEAWQKLSPVSLSESLAPAPSLTAAAGTELALWNDGDSAEVKSDSNQFGIRSLTLNVTQICNLNCTYCAAGGDGTYGDPVVRISVEKTLPQIRFFLDQIPAGGHFHIAFLGGEPLLYPLAIQNIAQYVFEECEKRGLTSSFKITTNGTLVDERVLNVLRGMNARVVVSLDGPAEVHDRQRKTRSGEGSFEQAFSGLTTLLRYRKDLAGVEVHAVFNEQNLEVEKAWDLFSELPIDSMEFTFSVNEPNLEISRVYNESLARVFAKAWDKGGEEELLRISNVREIFARLDDQRRRPNHCGLGKSFLVVDARNGLWTCPWMVGKKGNRLGQNSELDYEALKKHQKDQVETNGCQSCWARYLCGGGCSFIHGTTGGASVEKKIDFCERTRFLMAQALAYYGLARAEQEAR